MCVGLNWKLLNYAVQSQSSRRYFNHNTGSSWVNNIWFMENLYLWTDCHKFYCIKYFRWVQWFVILNARITLWRSWKHYVALAIRCLDVYYSIRWSCHYVVLHYYSSLPTNFIKDRHREWSSLVTWRLPVSQLRPSPCNLRTACISVPTISL